MNKYVIEKDGRYYVYDSIDDLKEQIIRMIACDRQYDIAKVYMLWQQIHDVNDAVDIVNAMSSLNIHIMVYRAKFELI